MRADVKPFTHWVIYKKYTVRFDERTPQRVTGTLTTPEGAQPFAYNPQTLIIQLDKRQIQINEHGWEIDN